MIIMIIAELSGRRRQSLIVLGGEGQSLGTKDALNIGLVDTHSSHVFETTKTKTPKFIAKFDLKLREKDQTEDNLTD